MSDARTMTQTTKATLSKGKQLAWLYERLNRIEAAIKLNLERIMQYQLWIHDGIDNTGKILDGEDKACLAALISDLSEENADRAKYAWECRQEIAALIAQAIMEANAWFLAIGNPLGNAKGRFVSPK